MKKTFRILVGILLFGILALSVYVGVWVLLVGGIVQIINEIKSPLPAQVSTIAWGIVKVLFFGVPIVCAVGLVIFVKFFQILSDLLRSILKFFSDNKLT